MSDISDQSEGSERCTHIVEALEGPEKVALSGKYKTAAAWYFQRVQDAIHPSKRRKVCNRVLKHTVRSADTEEKVASPMCGTCSATLGRPFVCLHCSYSGCWTNGHIRGHLRHTGHFFCELLTRRHLDLSHSLTVVLGADPKTGRVFCSQCDNFILNSAFEDLFSATVLRVEESETKFQGTDPQPFAHRRDSSAVVTKKGRETYHPWTPNEKDTAALKDAVQIQCQGRRGLLNLGQTCFLNVILQSFVHNPLLRNYFLSDKHNRAACKNTDCTCCELDKLFSEIYSGETVPYGPISFLATTWRASSELAGYAQQDAHELFITALGQIHATSRGSTNVSCNCIIHTTFLGQLQSEVKCERCGNITSTVDPMLDISLEVEGDKDTEATLGSCLRRFTKPETLGSKEYSCSKCKQTPHVSPRISLAFPRLTRRIAASNQTTKHPGAPASSEHPIQGTGNN